MHKYQPDGALGSSWHPYLHDDKSISPPIQEDETALTLYLFNEYYQLHKNEAYLNEYFDDFIKPMANFLASYIEPVTGLPRASYDLWEEVFLTTTYTTAIVAAALLAASELAALKKDDQNAVHWRTVAEDITSSARKHLYNDERKAFYKGLIVKKGEVIKDATIDTSAIYGAYMFDLFTFDGPEVTSSIQAMLDHVNVLTSGAIGLTRYENDTYRRVSDDISGNPWFVTTLWLAQYYHQTGEDEQAKNILRWCRSHMTASGVLPEQINPYTEEFVSVAPLAWSQAEYVSTLLDLI